MGNSDSKIESKLKEKPVVVIVGGGAGGVEAAKALDQEANVVLIDKKDYFHNNLGALRAAVDTSFAPKVLVPYSNLLRFGNVIVAEVSQVNENSLRLKGAEHQEIHFDYLIIATGMSYNFPARGSVPRALDLLALYHQSAQLIEQSQSILIIGGGPVGVELCGEIVHKHPDKQITLVHSSDVLIPGNYSLKLREDLKKLITDHQNVQLILEERVLLSEDLKNTESHFISGKRHLQTDKKRSIETDLIFLCGGSKPNTSHLSNFMESKLDEKKQIMVDPYLRVEGCKNIFAVGDCNNFPEPKLLFTASRQGKMAAANIIRLIQGNEIKVCKPLNLPVISVPFGPRKGVTQLPFGVYGNFFTSKMKAESLFFERFWDLMNLKYPAETAITSSPSFSLNKQRQQQQQQKDDLPTISRSQTLARRRIRNEETRAKSLSALVKIPEDLAKSIIDKEWNNYNYDKNNYDISSQSDTQL